jgi:hypothetical protein
VEQTDPWGAFLHSAIDADKRAGEPAHPPVSSVRGGVAQKVEDLKLKFWKKDYSQPVFMHPVIFISGAVLLGCLFAFQDWIFSRFWNYHMDLRTLLVAWATQFFLWGVICWFIWWQFRPQINNATLRTILTIFLPLSIVISVLEEMIWSCSSLDFPWAIPPCRSGTD